jgi:hypothetical protein
VITNDDIREMVDYWLRTPINSRLGSGFGNNANTLLAQPYNDGIADDFIKKMMTDLPVLQIMPAGSVNVFAIPRDFDKIDLFIDISGQIFEIPQN